MFSVGLISCGRHGDGAKGTKDGLAFYLVNWVVGKSQEGRCELNMCVK